MKKITIALIALLMTNSLWAQNYNRPDKTAWFDLQATQHFGLKPWINKDFVGDGLPGNSVTELRGTFNLYFAKPYFGIFWDMGLGILPAPRMDSFDADRMPMPHSGTQYFLRETIYESGSGGTAASFKMTAGFFGNIPVSDRLDVMPYFGVGFMTMPQRSYEIRLKEQGSNMEYKATYVWNCPEEYPYSYASAPGYLNGRLNFSYKMSPNVRLLLGVEYTQFFNSIDFYGKFTNVYNANIQRQFTYKGNNVNMMGISVGISFK